MAEGDYMSDDFLIDIRPGLLSKSTKRKFKEPKKDMPRQKKVKVLEEEARSKGLSAPLSSDNKGFNMLQKMGYKAGASLGKSGTGETSPIPIVIKDGKSGLGRKDFLVKKQVEKKKQEVLQYSDFRQRKQAEMLQVQVQSDLKKSKMACHQLDLNIGVSSPVVEWYWPEEFLNTDTGSEDRLDSEYIDEDDEEDDEEVELPEPLEQLESITSYLRSNHCYCIWCGTAYEDEADLEGHCPGDNKEVHD